MAKKFDNKAKKINPSQESDVQAPEQEIVDTKNDTFPTSQESDVQAPVPEKEEVKVVRTTIEIPEHIHQAIKIYCTINKISIKAFISKLIEQHYDPSAVQLHERIKV